MDDKIITKVPESLKRLVCVTGRAFYQPLQIVCLDILTKYPCVALTDLVEVLKMHGSQKQLQQALNILHKDKLVKWLQKMEVPESVGGTTAPQPAAAPKPRMVHYYYINYQQFVNVVKYKLDQMRKRLESEGKMSQNRISYKCSKCDSTFSDLDVDRLCNPSTGDMRCNFCGNSLEEEQQENVVDSRTLISQLNEYAKPITDLLRETENLNLAPELLEPEPQSISKYLLSGGVGRRASTAVREPSWNARSATNIYGDSTEVSVNIGDDSQHGSKMEAKERPAWLVKSTVHEDDNIMPDIEQEAAAATEPSKHLKREAKEKNRQILEDLMAHEAKHVPSLDPYLGQEPNPPRYSSSSSGEEDMGVEPGGGASSVAWMGAGGGFDDVEEFDEESSGDEGFTVTVGDKAVPLDEINDEMVAKMTKDEKERYTAVWQKKYSQDDEFD